MKKKKTLNKNLKKALRDKSKELFELKAEMNRIKNPTPPVTPQQITSFGFLYGSKHINNINIIFDTPPKPLSIKDSLKENLSDLESQRINLLDDFAEEKISKIIN